MGWEQILITALLTTVGTGLVALLTHQLAVKRDWHAQQERHARYLAIRLVTTLDTFILNCSDVASDHGEADERGDYGTTAPVPALILPDDVEWKSLEPSILYDVMALPNQIDLADRSISFVADMIATPPDYSEFFNERQERYARLGLTALEIANKLRTQFEIPVFNIRNDHWDFQTAFEETIIRIEDYNGK